MLPMMTPSTTTLVAVMVARTRALRADGELVDDQRLPLEGAVHPEAAPDGEPPLEDGLLADGRRRVNSDLHDRSPGPRRRACEGTPRPRRRIPRSACRASVMARPASRRSPSMRSKATVSSPFRHFTPSPRASSTRTSAKRSADAEQAARLDGEVALQLEDARAHLALEVAVEPALVEPSVRVAPVLEPPLHLLEPPVEPVALQGVLEVELQARLGEQREELALEVPEVQRDVPHLLVALPRLGVARRRDPRGSAYPRARRPRADGSTSLPRSISLTARILLPVALQLLQLAARAVALVGVGCGAVDGLVLVDEPIEPPQLLLGGHAGTLPRGPEDREALARARASRRYPALRLTSRRSCRPRRAGPRRRGP